MTIDTIKTELRDSIMSVIDFAKEQTDDEIMDIIDRHIMQEPYRSCLDMTDKLRVRRELFNSIRRLDILTEYLERDDITEIMVNGHNSIFIEQNGHIVKGDKCFGSEAKLMSVVQQIVAQCNRRINETNPIVDARLSDGSRVNIVTKPIALDGTVVTIRKFPKERIDMDTLISLGSVSKEVAGLLQLMVAAGYNIFISGGTGSGKTTFLNALSDFIPKEERIVTIEDSAELCITGVSNIVRLESRNANVEGENEVSIRELVRASLRMRPDRIVVGEVRDEAVIDMITAMNTGHDGSISTGHANSCEDMMLRLETMYLMGMEIPVTAIRRQISSAIDIVIHLGRLRDRSRKVLCICEVTGMKNGEITLNTLFEFNEMGEKAERVVGKLVKVNDLVNTTKLMRGGFLSLYEEVCNKL